MRIHRILKKTYAEGPGCRFCIWVQGCAHKCPGCFAADLWDFSGGTEMSADEIQSAIREVSAEIDGITLLGGEPFAYATELAEIARFAHRLHKTVLTFTGYTYAELQCMPESRGLLQETDLLIDGRFEADALDMERPLVGSKNQRFIYLTERISEKEILEYKNRFEIRIYKNGKAEGNGMGKITELQHFLDGGVG